MRLVGGSSNSLRAFGLLVFLNVLSSDTKTATNSDFQASLNDVSLTFRSDPVPSVFANSGANVILHVHSGKKDGA